MGKRQLLWYLAQRIIALFVVLFLIASVDFVIFRVIPDHDIVVPRTMDQDFIEQIVSEYRLDRPLTEQYLWYMWNTLTLDFGFSVYYRKGVDIADLTGPSLERSLWLFAIAGALTVLAGVAYEAVASSLRTRVLRMTMRLVALGLLSMPVLGQTMLAFDINARVGSPLPWQSPPYNHDLFGGGDTWDRLSYNISHGIFPVAVCVLLGFGFVSLFFRRKAGDGLGPRQVWRGMLGVLGAMRAHPWQTKFYFAWIVSYILLVDVMFNYHGLGTLLWESILTRDFPLVMTMFLIIAGILAISNCIFDILAAVFSRRADAPSPRDDSEYRDSAMHTGPRESPSLISSVESIWTDYRRSKAGLAALIVFVAIAFAALAAPFLATVNPNDPSNFEPMLPSENWVNPLPPSLDSSPYTGQRHLLGTDQRGMDIYSAMLYGSRNLVLACVTIGILALVLGFVSGVVGATLPSTKGILTRGLGWLVDIVGDTFVAIPLTLMIVGLSIVQRWGFWFVSLLVAPLIFLWASVSVAQQVRRTAKAAEVSGGGSRSVRRLFSTVLARALHITKLSIVIGLLTLLAIDFFGLFFDYSSWGAMLEGAYEREAVVYGAWWWYLSPILGTCLLLVSSFVIVDTLERIVRKKEYATGAAGAPSQSVTIA